MFYEKLLRYVDKNSKVGNSKTQEENENQFPFSYRAEWMRKLLVEIQEMRTTEIKLHIPDFSLCGFDISQIKCNH